MYDRSVANPANFQADNVSEGYEPSVADDPIPEEPPVDKAEGELLQEDRVVPYTDDAEMLWTMSQCGKVKCLGRMVDHVKAQALLVAHGAKVDPVGNAVCGYAKLCLENSTLGNADGVFVTCSIRRSPTPFNYLAEPLNLSTSWEFGYAALGNRPVYNKRVTQPFDLEAIHVQRYALEHPEEDIEPPDPGRLVPPEDVATGSCCMLLQRSMAKSDLMMMLPQRLQYVPDLLIAIRARFADAAFSAMDAMFLVDDTPAGEQAPKTPKLDDEAKK
eukprot:s843_g3.t1